MFIRFDLGSTFFALANWCTLTISSSDSSSFKNLWDGGMLGNCMVAENERERENECEVRWTHCNYIQLPRSIEREIILAERYIYSVCVGPACWLAGCLIESAKTLQTKNGLCAQNCSFEVFHCERIFLLSSRLLYIYIPSVRRHIICFMLEFAVNTEKEAVNIIHKQTRRKKDVQRWINSMVFVCDYLFGCFFNLCAHIFVNVCSLPLIFRVDFRPSGGQQKRWMMIILCACVQFEW